MTATIISHNTTALTSHFNSQSTSLALTLEVLKVNVLNTHSISPLCQDSSESTFGLIGTSNMAEERKAAIVPVTDVLHTKTFPVLLHTHILGWSSLGHSCCRLSHCSVITDTATIGKDTIIWNFMAPGTVNLHALKCYWNVLFSMLEVEH